MTAARRPLRAASGGSQLHTRWSNLRPATTGGRHASQRNQPSFSRRPVGVLKKQKNTVRLPDKVAVGRVRRSHRRQRHTAKKCTTRLIVVRPTAETAARCGVSTLVPVKAGSYTIDPKTPDANEQASVELTPPVGSSGFMSHSTGSTVCPTDLVN